MPRAPVSTDIGLEHEVFGSRDDLAAVRSLVHAARHADDIVALLDALGVQRAHVVGASMGGMITQLAAIRHPERTATLTSVMSSTGGDEYGRPTPERRRATTAGCARGNRQAPRGAGGHGIVG